MARSATNNGDPTGPRNEAREHVRKAVRLATHAAARGDRRGAWEMHVCAARLVLAGCPAAGAVGSRLRAGLEAAALTASFDEQVSLLRRALEEAVGPCDAGPLPGSETDALAEIQAWISHAISLGAPAYNHGDQRGCYEVYAATARLLLETVHGAEEARERLREALRGCAVSNNVDEQAWTMRHAFDAVLAPTPTAGTEEMRALLVQAIQIGAPAYNSGDQRGCYEIYAATTRLIVKTCRGGEPAKELLQTALERCGQLDDPDQQAWTMRRAFDAILAGASQGPGPRRRRRKPPNDAAGQ
jgi:hypothetical protein